MEGSLQQAAAASTRFSNFTELVGFFVDIINPLYFILVALAMLVFFKGLVVFIYNAGDTKSHADGKNLMIWGLIGLFVMLSVFGILRFVYRDIGLTGSFGIPVLPTNPPNPSN